MDRLLSEYAGNRRVARVHSAAASLAQVSQRHRRYSDVERQLGTARTLRVDVGNELDILNAVRCLRIVEEAYPHYPRRSRSTSACRGAHGEAETAWVARDLIHAAEAAAYQPGDPAVIVSVLPAALERSRSSACCAAGTIP